MRLSNQRGSALILAIVVVLVGTVIGVAMMRFGAREVAGAGAAYRTELLRTCADMGRQVIAARFRPISSKPETIGALDEKLGGGSQVTLLGGHYGSDPAKVQIEQVTVLPEAAFGPNPSGEGSLGNRTSTTPPGGQPLKVVVRCKVGGDDAPDSGRQLEVEFGLRFGI